MLVSDLSTRKTNLILLYWVPASSLSFVETHLSVTVFCAVCIALWKWFYAPIQSERLGLFEQLVSCRTYAKRTSRSNPLPCPRWHVLVPLSVGRCVMTIFSSYLLDLKKLRSALKPTKFSAACNFKSNHVPQRCFLGGQCSRSSAHFHE